MRNWLKVVGFTVVAARSEAALPFCRATRSTVFFTLPSVVQLLPSVEASTFSTPTTTLL